MDGEAIAYGPSAGAAAQVEAVTAALREAANECGADWFNRLGWMPTQYADWLRARADELDGESPPGPLDASLSVGTTQPDDETAEPDDCGLVNGLCGCVMWPSGKRCTIVGNHIGAHRE